MRGAMLACVVFGVLALGEREAHAQARDSLLNGTVIGAAVGAEVGVALTHATRDSELGFEQYAYGALIFGAIGGGVGLGVDALLKRVSPGAESTRRRVLIAPTVWRHVEGRGREVAMVTEMADRDQAGFGLLELFIVLDHPRFPS